MIAPGPNGLSDTFIHLAHLIKKGEKHSDVEKEIRKYMYMYVNTSLV